MKLKLGAFWAGIFMLMPVCWTSLALNVADFTVQVGAQVQTNPPQITLTWPADPDATAYTVYRKSRDANSWGAGTALASNATSYVDTNVAVGEAYEYRIVKNAMEGSTGYTGYGYIYAGIEAPLVEYRGKVLLLVDATVTNALAFELSRLQWTLIGDGWNVLRYDVARTSTPPEIKAIITNAYWNDPEQPKAVFLFGHVPVPYSGYIAPDGHGDHNGAWSADVYYADMDGNWTDMTVNTTNASRVENRNVPGDGKFDQSTIPSDLELQVGRVDLWNMPAFPASETELLRQYLNKEWNFRMGLFRPPRRGLVDDHFGTFYNEAFAANGYRNFAPFFGASNVFARPWFSTLATNAYLWGYACGPGSYTSEGGVGTTSDFVRTNTQVVFTMHFGSYFGDFDSQNNLMRAQLANAGGGLTCAWAGRPHWHFHHMALGEHIGFSALKSQNNSSSMYVVNFPERYVHINLLGDPTLRMHVVLPPSSLSISSAGNERLLRWRASPDSVLGYHVYGASTPAGPFLRLNPALITETNFTDSNPVSTVYMVRAVKLETSASGTYYNASQGIFEDLSGTLGQPHAILSQPASNMTYNLDVPIPLSVEASDLNNDIVRVEFYTNGSLLAVSSNWPYSVFWTNAWLGTYNVSAVAWDAAGMSATTAVRTVTVTYSISYIITNKSVWRYFDQMQDLGTAWRAPDYDDSSWSSGPAELGFGENDEATVINTNRQRITTYFRKAFWVPPNGRFLGYYVQLLRDDGGVVYLNGVEVFRSNMPTNQPIVWSTQASSAADESNLVHGTNVPPQLIRPGTNYIAVEIHQYGTNSSDLSFDLSLIATNLPSISNTPPSISVVPDVVTDEDTPSAPVQIVVGDAECWPEGVEIIVTSSNSNLISAANVTFIGSGSNRLMVITPATNQNGNATITLTASDGLATASTTFNVLVNPIPDPPVVQWINPVHGALLSAGNVPLQVNAYDPDGDLSRVEFYLDGVLVAQTNMPPFGVIWSNAPMGYHGLSARAYDSSGLSSWSQNLFVSVLAPPVALVSTGAVWKYWDRGAVTSVGWYLPDFDDNDWASGPSPLGYGDANGIYPVTTNSYGPYSTNKYITTYYRRTFQLTNVHKLTNLVVSIQRDDGAIVYLNGVEVFRSNMRTGLVDFTTLSETTVSGAAESGWYSTNISASLLVEGQNVLAAEVHQAAASSSDLFFNLQMTAQLKLEPPPVSMTLQNERLELEWPAWAQALSLWSATNLLPPVTWQPVDATVIQTNGYLKVTLPRELVRQRFFRLQGW